MQVPCLKRVRQLTILITPQLEVQLYISYWADLRRAEGASNLLNGSPMPQRNRLKITALLVGLLLGAPSPSHAVSWNDYIMRKQVQAHGVEMPIPGSSLLTTGKIPRNARFELQGYIDLPGKGAHEFIKLEETAFPYPEFLGRDLHYENKRWRILNVGPALKEHDYQALNESYREFRKQSPEAPVSLYLAGHRLAANNLMSELCWAAFQKVIAAYRRSKHTFSQEALDKISEYALYKAADNFDVFIILKDGARDLRLARSFDDLDDAIAGTMQLLRWEQKNFDVPEEAFSDPSVMERSSYLSHFAWAGDDASAKYLEELSKTRRIGEVLQSAILKDGMPEAIKDMLLLEVLRSAEDPRRPLDTVVFTWNDAMVRLFRIGFPGVEFQKVMPIRIGESDHFENLMIIDVSQEYDSSFQKLKRALLERTATVDQRKVRATNARRKTGTQ